MTNICSKGSSEINKCPGGDAEALKNEDHRKIVPKSKNRVQYASCSSNALRLAELRVDDWSDIYAFMGLSIRNLTEASSTGGG